MKVLLINISLRPNSRKIIFPIGFGYIATAVKRAGFDFEILDLDALRPPDKEVEEYIKKTEFDVAAFGCIVTGYKYVKKLAETIKKYKDVPVVVGNSVASSIPKILLTKTKADVGVMGEGDTTIVELLKAIENKAPLEEVRGIFFKKNGEIFFTPPREIISDLDTLPIIDYELFNMETYIDKCRFNVTEPYPVDFSSLRALPIDTARGCPYNCTFCYHVFKKNKYRFRSTENICREIKYLQEKYGLNYAHFFDDLTFFSKEQAGNFADYVIKEGLKFFWSANVRAGLLGENDLDVALKLKKSGCVELVYSLESANEEILRAMNKRISLQDFTNQTKILQKAGIPVSTSLVIGYPQETKQTIQETFDCCYENNIYPSTGYLLPQPGTPIYDLAVKSGKIKDEEKYLLEMGDRQDFHINLTEMPQEKVEELVENHLKRIAEKLNLNLDKDHLIKTEHYVGKKTEN